MILSVLSLQGKESLYLPTVIKMSKCRRHREWGKCGGVESMSHWRRKRRGGVVLEKHWDDRRHGGCCFRDNVTHWVSTVTALLCAYPEGLSSLKRGIWRWWSCLSFPRGHTNRWIATPAIHWVLPCPAGWCHGGLGGQGACSQRCSFSPAFQGDFESVNCCSPWSWVLVLF